MVYEKVSSDMNFVDRENRLKSSGRIMIYSRRVLITARRGKQIHFMMDLQQLMVSHISDMFLQEL